MPDDTEGSLGRVGLSLLALLGCTAPFLSNKLCGQENFPGLIV